MAQLGGAPGFFRWSPAKVLFDCSPAAAAARSSSHIYLFTSLTRSVPPQATVHRVRRRHLALSAKEWPPTPWMAWSHSPNSALHLQSTS